MTTSVIERPAKSRTSPTRGMRVRIGFSSREVKGASGLKQPNLTPVQDRSRNAALPDAAGLCGVSQETCLARHARARRKSRADVIPADGVSLRGEPPHWREDRYEGLRAKGARARRLEHAAQLAGAP